MNICVFCNEETDDDNLFCSSRCNDLYLVMQISKLEEDDKKNDNCPICDQNVDQELLYDGLFYCSSVCLEIMLEQKLQLL